MLVEVSLVGVYLARRKATTPPYYGTYLYYLL